MKCSTCDSPMTLLFTSSVCDTCNPPAALAEFMKEENTTPGGRCWAAPYSHSNNLVWNAPFQGAHEYFYRGEMEWQDDGKWKKAGVDIFKTKLEAMKVFDEDSSYPVAWPVPEKS